MKPRRLLHAYLILLNFAFSFQWTACVQNLILLRLEAPVPAYASRPGERLVSWYSLFTVI